MSLFTADDLGDLIDCTVSTEKAAAVERVVWGWLMPVLKLTERPDPVPADVFAWAIELGAIYHENPSGLEAYQLGNERTQYSAERRREILEDAGNGGVTPAAVPAPRGKFPAAQCWPDPPRAW